LPVRSGCSERGSVVTSEQSEDRMTRKLERAKGFEPSTLTLATCKDIANNSKTIGAAAQKYFSDKPANERYWKELARRFDTRILPDLGTYTLVSSVTKQKVRDYIWKDQRKYPAAARTLWDALGPFFKFCVQWDYCDKSPMADLIPPPLVPSRDRVLTEDEIAIFWKATADDWYWSSFFRVLLLTGQRRQEIALLKHMNITRDKLIIPSDITKTKTTNVLPMVHMISIELNRSRWLGKNPSGFSKAKKELDKRLGFDDYRIHDLRRTFRTYLSMLRVHPTVAELLINHKVKGVQGVYDRYSYLPEKKEALDKYCTFILSLTNA